MRGKRMKMIGLILLSILLLNGCNLFPEPESLIQAPKHVKAAGQAFDLLSIAQRNLPKGTELAVPNGPVATNPVISVDLDEDGNDELFVLYRSKMSQFEVGAFVLKKNKNGWEKVFAKKGTGSEISWASAADVTGDGQKEILLGWQSGVSGNVLEIYTWKKDKLVKMDELDYHDIEAITFKEDQTTRIALWKRDMADVYKIDLLRWDGQSFVPDLQHYPSYFKKVVAYYKQRTLEVPNAAYYWYYLADAQLKANHPELALEAVNKGMKMKSIVPTMDYFQQLKDQIEKKLVEAGDNAIVVEFSDPDLSFLVPRDLAPFVSVRGDQDQFNPYIVSVEVSSNQKKKEELFSIEVYTKDYSEQIQDPALMKIGEEEKFIYFVRLGKQMNDAQSMIFQNALAKREQIISSIQFGPMNQAYISLEEQLVIEKVKEASEKYWYVVSGGKMAGDEVETISINNHEYRYLGSDLNTTVKLVEFLSSSFTLNAIDSFLKRAKIFEYFDRLVQPNADGGSILNYDEAVIVQKKDKGNEKEFDIKVPLGDSFSYEFVHISFQKNENGWRIFSEPGTF